MNSSTTIATVTPLVGEGVIGHVTDIYGHVAHQVAYLQEQIVRDQLIAAGWRPPGAPTAEHELALAFLAGLHTGDLTISDPPMAVAERIFDSVMSERAGLEAEIKQQERALEGLRQALARARLEKAQP